MIRGSTPVHYPPMPQRDHGPIILPILMLVGLCVFLTGVGWGLPSRWGDAYFFGDRPAWDGERILGLAGDRGSERVGADVDRTPSSAGDVLNDTDARRAQIVRRYRLFTDQPDEMITMMALASMRLAERDFDPKLYQYGGLWIYPVAGLIKVGANLKPQAHYLNRPGEFGWFYVLARLYSAAWGFVGIWAVYRLASRAGAGEFGATCAGLLFILLPVVVNQAHEAKPHLAGGVLILIAALAGGRFVDTGRAKWWMFTGAMCGAAAGMILSAAVGIAILPMMVLMVPMTWSRRALILCGAGAIAAGAYFLTNPYVLIHLLGDRSILQSNLQNSAAMYPVGTRLAAGLVNAIRLFGHSATPVGAAMGVIGAVVIWRWRRVPGDAALRLLVGVSAIVLVQFVMLAADKPGEYGRFVLVPAIASVVCLTVWVGRSRIRTFERLEAMAIVLVLAGLQSGVYLKGYSDDAGPEQRREEYAVQLAFLNGSGARTLGVFNEPAPYCLPPVDLLNWRIKLLPIDWNWNDGALDVIVRPVDQLPMANQERGTYRQVSQQKLTDLFPARISWAAKPMEIWVRKDLLGSPATRSNE